MLLRLRAKLDEISQHRLLLLMVLLSAALVPACGGGGGGIVIPGPQAPAPPTALLAIGGDGLVTLSWAASGGATSYNIKRSNVSGGPYAIVAAGMTATSFTNTGLTNGTTYYFVVSGVNGVGEGADSLPGLATPTAPVTAPSSPTGLAATAGLDAHVPLSWTASAGAASYTLQRGIVSGAYTVTVPGIVATTYNDATAVNGTQYFYIVVAVNSVGPSPASSEVSATPQTPPSVPAEPTGLAATTGLDGHVPLSWTASAGATSYAVKRGTVSGTYTVTVPGIVGTTYDDTTAVDSTPYFYVVLAVNSVGPSPASSEVSGTPQAAATVPGTPSSLIASAANARVDLSWKAPSGTVTSYTIRRGTATGVYPTTFTSIPTAQTTYSDTTALNSTQYFYVVAAVNSAGTGANSNEVNATPTAAPAPPAAPTSLAASSGSTTTNILTWTTSSGSYNILRNTTGSTTVYTIIAIGVAGSPYSDTGLVRGTTYYYAVTASNAGGTSGYSNQAISTILPTVPTGLIAGASGTQVSLSWTASTGGSSYNVKRSPTSGSGYVTISSPTTTNYTDSGLTPGTTYYYVVSAAVAGAESANSAQAAATITPAVPTGLGATATGNQISLTWTGSLGAASYNVMRSTTSGSGYVTVGSPAGSNFTDSGLANGTTYYYVVSAVNAGGQSGNSTEASATTAPATPTGLGAAGGSGQISLTWTASLGATSYNVRRSTTSGTGYVVVGSPGGSSYIDAGLSNGTAYFYVVSAVNLAGESANSTQASAATLTYIFTVTGDHNGGTFSMIPGEARTMTVTVAVTQGAPAPVNLTLSALPAGTTANFAPAAVTPNNTSVLSITTTASTPLGATQMTISATNGTNTQTSTFNLLVRSNAVIQPIGLAIESGGTTALVTETASVIRLDIPSRTVRKTIVDGFPANGRPKGIAIESGGTTALVATDDGHLLRVNLASGTYAVLSTGLTNAYGLAIEASGTSALSTDFSLSSTAGRLVRIDLAGGGVTPITALLNAPKGMAIESGGTTVLIAEYGLDRLSRVDLSSGTISVIGTGTTGLGGPTDVALEASGAALVSSQQGPVTRVIPSTGTMVEVGSALNNGLGLRGLALEGSGASVLVADAGWNRIDRITLESNDTSIAPATQSAATFSNAMDIMIEGGGLTALVTDAGGPGPQRLVRVTLASGTLTPLSVLVNPIGIAIESGGATALVVENGSKRLDRIDLSSGIATPLVTGFSSPQFVAIEAGGTTALVTDNASVYRATLATGVTTLIGTLTTTSGWIYLEGIAIESGGSTALVADAGSSVLWRLNLSTGVFTSVSAGMGDIFGVRIESGGGTAIVASKGTTGGIFSPSGGPGRVYRVNLSSGVWTSLAVPNQAEYGVSSPGPLGLDIEAGGNTAIVTDHLRLARVSLAPTLATQQLASSLEAPSGLAIESGGTTALFVDSGPYTGPNSAGPNPTTQGRLMRVDLSTGALTPIATDLNTPHSLAIESTGSALVTVCGSSGTTSCGTLGQLLRVTLGGSESVITSGLNMPDGIFIAPGGATALVAERGAGRLLSVDLSTGVFSIIASGLTNPRQVYLEASGATALVGVDTAIVRVDLTTGAISALAGGLSQYSIQFAVESGGTTALVVPGFGDIHASSPIPLLRVGLTTGAVTVLHPNLFNDGYSVVLEGSGSTALVIEGGLTFGAIVSFTVPP